MTRRGFSQIPPRIAPYSCDFGRACRDNAFPVKNRGFSAPLDPNCAPGRVDFTSLDRFAAFVTTRWIVPSVNLHFESPKKEDLDQFANACELRV